MSKFQSLEDLANRPVAKLLWEYSLPAVVGMVVMALYNIIDRMVIGHVVGPDAIAGLTITFPVMNIATAIGVLVGGGSAARVSILLGSDNHNAAQKVLGNAVSLTLLNGAIYITLLAVFLDDILRAFGASEVTLPYAHEFMVYILPGLLLTNFSFSLNNVIRASGAPRRAMVTMLIGAGLNMILAPTFVYGLDMGIKGAAIATDISMFISMLTVVHYFTRKSSTLVFKRGIYKIDRKVAIEIVAIGAAPCVVNVASCFINVIINNTLLKYGGDSAVAAAGIFTTYTAMIVSIIIGICQGMQPIVGYNYGAGKLNRLRNTYLLAVAVATVICTVGWAGGLFAPSFIASVFTVDENLINVTSHALSLSMVCFWMVGFQIISTTFFQSLGRAGQSVFLGLTRQVIFLIPFLLIFTHYKGLDGIWTSFPASDTCATVVTAIMILLEFRRIKKLEEKKTGI